MLSEEIEAKLDGQTQQREQTKILEGTVVALLRVARAVAQSIHRTPSKPHNASCRIDKFQLVVKYKKRCLIDIQLYNMTKYIRLTQTLHTHTHTHYTLNYTLNTHYTLHRHTKLHTKHTLHTTHRHTKHTHTHYTTISAVLPMAAMVGLFKPASRSSTRNWG